MADSDSNLGRPRPRPVEAEVIVSPLVPDGHAMVPVQVRGRTVLALHPDHGTEQLAKELTDHLAHATRVGMAVLYNPLDDEPRSRPEV
ncbi:MULTISPECIES: hypothetical protein [unclassified Streptomyces]|uniref:hypothetical protein n=1 Tax=unclassified Streptomyces TaxID=2593676 RepID=UPI0022705831|nr:MULTISPECIES: hypothetical protein [unclassified Streptomyces]MCY0921878.1 hypothetical protein [Streptomyces sp. H27-G5]MCY0957173.1 hypothetical protein [Streptomyces sp. H27-H5]